MVTDLVAVHARHHDVEQDQVGRVVRLVDLQRFLAAIGHFDLVVVLEQAAHQREVVGGVVDHQHGGLFNEIEFDEFSCQDSK